MLNRGSALAALLFSLLWLAADLAVACCQEPKPEGSSSHPPASTGIPAQTFPSSAESLFYMAATLEECETADEAYRLLLERFPEHALADDALLARAMQHYSLGYHRTAETELRQLTELYPDSPGAQEAGYWRGVVLLALGDLDAALDCFSRLTDRFPGSEKSAWARIGIADCFRLKGEMHSAVQVLEESLERFPSADQESAALFQLAKIYEDLGEEDRALALRVQLANLYPDSPEGAQALARLGPMASLAPITELEAPPPEDLAEEPDEQESPPQEPVPEQPVPAEPRAFWAVQVGAFSVWENAIRLERVLQARGYENVTVASDSSGQDVIHRVRVGDFAQEDSAKVIARILHEQDHLEVHVLSGTIR